VNSFDALRALHCQRGDSGDAVTTVRGERFQVGGGAGAAGRIETCDRQQDGRRWVAVSVRAHRLFFTPTTKIAGRVSETDRHLRMYARCNFNARKNLMIFLFGQTKEVSCSGPAPSFIAFWK